MKFGSTTYGMGDTLLLTSVCKYFPNKFTIQLTKDVSRFSIFFEHLANVEICEKHQINPILDIGFSLRHKKIKKFFWRCC